MAFGLLSTSADCPEVRPGLGTSDTDNSCNNPGMTCKYSSAAEGSGSSVDEMLVENCICEN
eukprot:CAMPEP_0168218806 /NCGR_PEP_ID=MMETSP0140_2-20121125/8146_1 /TAXON_ID=44445 /ORGANISM="Pseudo-nitzschia australis, Strain 10249 10 AB" /LENGTH=60 /DNA_ID=CAMNT_0008146991 /DNA_START=73 /DNA_END=252 /DNA_ORIENTATION=-